APAPTSGCPATGAPAGGDGRAGGALPAPGPGAGPDGFVAAPRALSPLSPGSAVTAVTVTRAAGTGWASGTNPGSLNNAEYLPNASDPTQGDLYFSPDTNLAGQTLTVSVTYAAGKTARATAAPPPPTPPPPT